MKQQNLKIISLAEFQQSYHFDDFVIEQSHQNDNQVFYKEDYIYGFVHIVDRIHLLLKKDYFCYYIFKDLFLIVVIDDNDHHLYQLIDENRQFNNHVYMISYFFYSLLIKDDDVIKKIKEELESLDDSSQEKSSLFYSQLSKINKELFVLQDDYDHLMSIGEELQIYMKSLFKKEDLFYLDIFMKRVQRLSHHISLLQEYAIQIKETYQSQINYSMNKTMEFFTIITTLFMPLTLMTGWYGMNFKYIPELEYQYSYYIFICICLLMIIFFIYWFKKKKYF